jgi:putative ABC transport system permease protein
MVRSAISNGLTEQGTILLGGDAQMEFTYRFATEAERAFMAAEAVAVSEVVDFRSMVVAGPAGAEERALTQVKSVDSAYPLVGTMELEPAIPLSQALAGDGTRPGAVMDRVLVERLGLKVGDTMRLGTQEFRRLGHHRDRTRQRHGRLCAGPADDGADRRRWAIPG